MELKKSLQKQDDILFISGLDDLVRFIYDLMNEKTDGNKKRG